jgi:hypothetical protein
LRVAEIAAVVALLALAIAARWVLPRLGFRG